MTGRTGGVTVVVMAGSVPGDLWMPSTLAVAGSYRKAGFLRLDTPETRLTGPVRGCERGVMTRSRVIRRWLSLTGFAFAVAFYCLR